MTQEEKNLLLKDLSARLQCGVKIYVNDKIEILQGINVLDKVAEYSSFLSCGIEEVKPYLFPLSSMTKKERDFLHANAHGIYVQLLDNTLISASIEGFDWLNKNHFDYRGLIEKGLAIDATGLNIY